MPKEGTRLYIKMLDMINPFKKQEMLQILELLFVDTSATSACCVPPTSASKEPMMYIKVKASLKTPHILKDVDLPGCEEAELTFSVNTYEEMRALFEKKSLQILEASVSFLTYEPGVTRETKYKIKALERSLAVTGRRTKEGENLWSVARLDAAKIPIGYEGVWKLVTELY